MEQLENLIHSLNIVFLLFYFINFRIFKFLINHVHQDSVILHKRNGFFFLLKAIAIHERNPCFWTPNIDLLDVSIIKSRGKESRDETEVIPTMKWNCNKIVAITTHQDSIHWVQYMTSIFFFRKRGIIYFQSSRIKYFYIHFSSLMVQDEHYLK